MRLGELTRQLRQVSGEYLSRKLKTVVLVLIAAGSMGLISLYQMGIIEHLPEPPLPYFDADKVDAAAEAYAKLSTPDAVIGLGSYAATMGLAAMGGQDRATERPWIPRARAAKVAFDAVQAGKLSPNQWTEHQAFCFWCLLAAGSTFITAPLVVPEACAALRQLLA